MKVARYENKQDTSTHELGELYCSFTMTDEEYGRIGRPKYAAVSLKPDGMFVVRSAKSGGSAVTFVKNTGRYSFIVWGAVFPGTKIFGAEDVLSESTGDYGLLCTFPEMTTPVKRQLSKTGAEKLKARRTMVEELTDEELVGAVRRRLQENPRWRIVATDEGRNFKIDTGSL